MKGWEPGGKEWPTILTDRQIGGSISSFRASSNLLVFLMDPIMDPFVIDLRIEVPVWLENLP